MPIHSPAYCPYFLCFLSDQGSPKYVFVKSLKTWYVARRYCRSSYTDLASVRNISENEKITSLLSSKTWIGLHRKLWNYWSDRTHRTFTKWHKDQPSNSKNTMASCAAVNTTTGTWWNLDCKEKHYFVCQNVSYPRPRAQHRTMLKFQSEADLNDPADQQQILEQVQ